MVKVVREQREVQAQQLKGGEVALHQAQGERREEVESQSQSQEELLRKGVIKGSQVSCVIKC